MAGPAPRAPRIAVEDVGGVAVVTFADRRILESSVIHAIGEDLYRLVDELGRRQVLLDFGNVEYLSSAALGKLIMLDRKLQAVRGKLVICGLADGVRDVLVATKVDQLVTVVTDPALAGAGGVLREVFGDPFRPSVFSPQWRTDAAVALARGMDEAGDFSAMPILADALQDAGCDRAEVLDHCRGDWPHVRGCWVVDLVLGKE